MNAAASAVHVSVSLVTVDDDSPALLPRNWPSAGTKSPDDSPCRYSSGSTSLTWGVLRAHGGRIAEENRIRCPVPGSVRLSFTRGAVTSGPGAGHHGARLRGPVAHHQAAAVLVTNPAELVDVGGDLGLQRRGQHLPGAVPHDLIDQRRRLPISRQRASHVWHYCEHGCTFPARRSSAGHCLRPLRLGHREGTPSFTSLPFPADPQVSSIAPGPSRPPQARTAPRGLVLGPLALKGAARAMWRAHDRRESRCKLDPLCRCLAPARRQIRTFRK